MAHTGDQLLLYMHPSSQLPPFEHISALTEACKDSPRRLPSADEHCPFSCRPGPPQMTIFRVTGLGAPVDPQSGIPTLVTRDVSLFRRVPRKIFEEVSREALTAIAPGLVDVDPQAIRDNLLTLSPQMYEVACQTRANPHMFTAPHEISILIENFNRCDPPTHMLGVHQDREPGETSKVKLYPVHAIVLAVNCARVAAFPAPVHEGPPESPMTVPIHYIQLPYPEYFPLLLRYLYTKNRFVFTAGFIPQMVMPTTLQDDPKNKDELMKWALELCRIYTPSTLLTRLHPIRCMWHNMNRLGVIDGHLWEILDTLHEAILTAIAIGSGNFDKMQEKTDEDVSMDAGVKPAWA